MSIQFPHSMQAAIANIAAVAPATLTGPKTLAWSTENSNILAYDPGGASKDVTLWPVAQSEGAWALIINRADAAESLVLKNVAGTTIATVAQNRAGLVQCRNGAWELLAYIVTAAS